METRRKKQKEGLLRRTQDIIVEESIGSGVRFLFSCETGEEENRKAPRKRGKYMGLTDRKKVT